MHIQLFHHSVLDSCESNNLALLRQRPWTPGHRIRLCPASTLVATAEVALSYPVEVAGTEVFPTSRPLGELVQCLLFTKRESRNGSDKSRTGSLLAWCFCLGVSGTPFSCNMNDLLPDLDPHFFKLQTVVTTERYRATKFNIFEMVLKHM